jgi:hypothetical protein
MDFARTGHFVFELFSYGELHAISVFSFLLRIMKRKEQIFLADTATTERILSVLKLLKTYLRSTMSETRLNGLAI